MNKVKHLISAVIVLLILSFTAEAQFVGPAPLVVPANTYAFQYSPTGTIGGLTPFGLYFRAGGGTPGFEFRGASGAKLATVQSIASGQRDPGDITFGNTGSLIVNPNRYAFRFSLTKEYGLFFNAADRYYQFLNGVNAGGNVGSPVFSVQADSGNVGINILPTANDKLFAFRQNGSFGPGKSSIQGYRVGSPGNPLNGGLSFAPFAVDAAVKGFSDWGNQYSAAVYGFGVLDYINSAVIVGYWNSQKWGSICYRDSNQVWAGYYNGDVCVTGSGGGSAILGNAQYAVEANGKSRINHTRISSFPYPWTNMNFTIDNMIPFGTYPGLALVSSADSAAGAVIYGIIGVGGGIQVADGSNSFAPVDASAFNVSSDRTVKKEITTITPENDDKYLQYIRDIETATFRYKTEDEVSRPYSHIGVIAQTLPKEVQAVMGATPGGTSNETKLGVSLADMSGLMMIGIKSLDEKQQDLEAENEALKEQVKALTEMMTRFDESLSSCCLNHKGDHSENIHAIPDQNGSWLGQNVPNPFDNSTAIQFYIPESVSTSEIRVTDVKGQLIKTFNLEKGYGEIKFDVSDISSGTYMYSLINDGEVVSTKKMILK